MRVSNRETERQKVTNDLMVGTALKLLAKRGLIPKGSFCFDGFHLAYAKVASRFIVPRSSITTRMARLFYGISQQIQPRSILVVGSYLANSLIWVAAPVLNNAKIVGVDINPHANQAARRNLSLVGAAGVEILEMDGHDAGRLFNEGIDLLLLDAESDECGKKIYYTLTIALEPHLAPGAILLAHDICYPLFRSDVISYLSLVRDRRRFTHSSTVGIDQFGLEVSRKLT